jgi:hypothetical protein
MKLRGLIPNFYIHVSVSDLYIPTIGPPTYLLLLFLLLLLLVQQLLLLLLLLLLE